MTDELPVNDLDTLSRSPQNLREAIDAYAQVFEAIHQGRVSADVLAEFDVLREAFSPKQIFALLRQYRLSGDEGGLTQWQRTAFDYLFLQKGGTASDLMPPAIAKAYKKAAAHSAPELAVALEDNIRDGRISDDVAFLNDVLALRLQDGSERWSYHIVCEAVRRVLHYQKPFLRGEAWAKSSAASIIASIDWMLREIDSDHSSLAQVYEEYYADKPYDEQYFTDSRFGSWASIQDANIRIRRGRVKLASFPQAAQLGQAADPITILKVLEFLADTYSRGLARDKAVEEAASLFKTIHSPAHFFALGEALQKFGGEFRSRVESALSKAFASFAVQNERLWETVAWCAALEPKKGDVISKLFGFVFKDVPSKNPDAFVKGFLDERDIGVWEVCYKRVPELAMRMLDISLLEFSNAANPALAPKLALYLKGAPDAYLELKSYLARNAEAARPQIGALSSNVRLALALAGKSSVETQSVLDELDSAVVAKPAGRKGTKSGRAERTAEGVRNAVAAAVVSQTPGLLSQMEFAVLLKEALEKIALPDDIAVRARGLAGMSNTLAEKIFEDVLADETLMAKEWRDVGEKTVECEEGSFLRMIGIKAVRFKKTYSFDVELICDQEKDETDAFHKVGHLDDVGALALDKRPFFACQWAVSVVQAEILRLFYKLHGGQADGCDIDSILIMLGLKEWKKEDFSPRNGSAAAAEEASAPPVQEKQPPQPKAPPIEINTKDFLSENFRAFEDFLNELRSRRAAMPSFKDIADAFHQLQSCMRVNKTVPPQGVEVMPAPNHVLQPYVEIVDIYNPSQSREMLNRLGIDSTMFHQDVIDAYFCRVDVRIGEGTRSINVCIIPPNYDVYVIGVDPTDVAETEDNACMAFMHLVLDVFRRAVVRLDDPDHTAPDVPAKHPQPPPAHPWARRVTKVVTDVTKGEFPVIVTSWKTSSSDCAGDGEEAEAGGSGVRTRADSRAGFLQSIFEDIYTAQGETPDVLASHGLFLRAMDYLKLIPDAAKAFPREAWRNGAKGPDDLKQDYSNIYIPLDSAAAVERALEILGKQRLCSAESPDAALDLNAVFEEETVVCGSPEAAFAKILLSRQGIRVNSDVFKRGRELFDVQPNLKRSYAALFKHVLDSVKTDDDSVTAVDVFRAFTEMSPLNPEKLFMAVSGAADYRLPYRFRQGGDMPDVCVFADRDFDVASGVPLDVVKIIAGNRVRMSSVSTEWLRGDNRSDEMSFAADKQNQYRSRQTGREISLEPRARAALVWEFEDGKQHAFTYLDTTRDSVNQDTLARIPAEKKLRSFPRVYNAIRGAETENASGIHSDFCDLSHWNMQELIRLEREGVVGLSRDAHGRVTGIEWSKPIRRKKIVIFKDEQVGYRQFQLEPTTFAAYQRFLHQNGVEEMPAGVSCDPKTARIRKIFYDLLGI